LRCQRAATATKMKQRAVTAINMEQQRASDLGHLSDIVGNPPKLKHRALEGHREFESPRELKDFESKCSEHCARYSNSSARASSRF
jgi:hypothetical protein